RRRAGRGGGARLSRRLSGTPPRAWRRETPGQTESSASLPSIESTRSTAREDEGQTGDGQQQQGRGGAAGSVCNGAAAGVLALGGGHPSVGLLVGREVDDRAAHGDADVGDGHRHVLGADRREGRAIAELVEEPAEAHAGRRVTPVRGGARGTELRVAVGVEN